MRMSTTAFRSTPGTCQWSLKQQDEVETKYRLRLTKPRADAGLLNGIKNLVVKFSPLIALPILGTASTDLEKKKVCTRHTHIRFLLRPLYQQL